VGDESPNNERIDKLAALTIRVRWNVAIPVGIGKRTIGLVRVLIGLPVNFRSF
jgi:hypothetical protein